MILLGAILKNSFFVLFALLMYIFLVLGSCFLVLGTCFVLLRILRELSRKTLLVSLLEMLSLKLMTLVRILAPRFGLELTQLEEWLLPLPFFGIILWLQFWRRLRGSPILSSRPFT